MNASEEALVREMAGRIAQARPELLKYFHNYLDVFFALEAPVAPGFRESLKSLLPLTLATEFAWAEPRALLGAALARGELPLLAALLRLLSLRDPRLAQVLVDLYPSLRHPLGPVEGPLRAFIEALGPDGSEEGRSAALRGRGAEAALRLALGRGGEEARAALLSVFALVARHAPAVLADLVALYLERARANPESRLLAWLARGADLMTSGRVEEGVKLLLLESGAGRGLLGLSRITLAEYRNVLRIYAASVGGRDFAVNALEVSAYGLGESYTDGATLFLPAVLDWFREPEQNRRAYSAFAALEAASVALGSFSLDFDTLDFRTELRERYGTLLPEILPSLRRQYGGLAEAVRERKDGEIEAVFQGGRRLLLLATEHERLFFSLPVPELARALFDLVENLRLEARLSFLYTGLAKDFALVDALLWKRRQTLVIESDGDEEKRAFVETVEAMVQYSLRGSWGLDIADPKALTRLGRIRTLIDEAREPAREVADSAATMFALFNVLFEAFRLERLCKRVDLRLVFSVGGRPGLRPEIVRESRPELMKGERRHLEAPREEGEAKAVDLTSLGSRIGDDAVRRAIGAGKVRIYRYPEFDHLRGAYRENRCSLFESVPAPLGGDWCEAAERRHALVLKRARKRFLAMRPDEMELTRGWHDGTEINISDAVDYSIALRRGETPDGKIYFRKVLNRRDLCAAVLLDASNSTDALVGGSLDAGRSSGREGGRRVIDIEKDSLVVLASALDAIGDVFGLFAFNSMGPNKVFFKVIKDFEEPWSGAAKGRVAAIEPWESNRDGCAIRHVAARLSRRSERTKLLLLLSDGIPADPDYGAQYGRVASRYAIEDTRRAILEAREAGVVPFCLTIDELAQDYIGHLYGARRWALLDEVDRLPERLAQLYLRLTR